MYVSDYGVALAVAEAFLANGQPPPFVRWSPADLELKHPILRRFARVVHKTSGADGRLMRRNVDLQDYVGVMDWLMLLEREGGSGGDADGGELIYRRYGACIADHFGRDMTGKPVSGFGGHISTFFEAIYVESARRREMVLTVHEPPEGVFVARWRRLAVPLIDDDGEVRAFLAVNIPENDLRAGLDIVPDPVIVADGARRIQYLNRAARDLFGLSRLELPRLTLEEATGMPFDPERTPEAMVGLDAVTDGIHIDFNGAIAQRCMVTTSAATLRGRAYYVVMIRLLDA